MNSFNLTRSEARERNYFSRFSCGPGLIFVKMADSAGGVSNLHPPERGPSNVPLNGVISPYLGVDFIRISGLEWECG